MLLFLRDLVESEARTANIGLAPAAIAILVRAAVVGARLLAVLGRVVMGFAIGDEATRGTLVSI